MLNARSLKGILFKSILLLFIVLIVPISAYSDIAVSGKLVKAVMSLAGLKVQVYTDSGDITATFDLVSATRPVIAVRFNRKNDNEFVVAVAKSGDYEFHKFYIDEISKKISYGGLIETMPIGSTNQIKEEVGRCTYIEENSQICEYGDGTRGTYKYTVYKISSDYERLYIKDFIYDGGMIKPFGMYYEASDLSYDSKQFCDDTVLYSSRKVSVESEAKIGIYFGSKQQNAVYAYCTGGSLKDNQCPGYNMCSGVKTGDMVDYYMPIAILSDSSYAYAHMKESYRYNWAWNKWYAPTPYWTELASISSPVPLSQDIADKIYPTANGQSSLPIRTLFRDDGKYSFYYSYKPISYSSELGEFNGRSLVLDINGKDKGLDIDGYYIECNNAGSCCRLKYFGGKFSHFAYDVSLKSSSVCEDKDGDGHFKKIATCQQGDDCNDADKTVYPGATEICNNKDNDCDGEVDENCVCNETDTSSRTSLSTGNYSHSQNISNDISLTYDSNRASESTLGRGWIHSFDTKIEMDADGSLEFTEKGTAVNFNLSGSTYKAEPRSGMYAEIAINPDSAYTLTKKNGDVYQFNSQGQLLSITDRNGNQTVLTYSGDLLSSVIDFHGRATTFRYDTSDRIIQITDHAGRVTTLSYNPAGLLSSVTDPEGGIWTYTYDSSGRMISKTDPTSSTSYMHYDSEGRMVQATNPEGNIKILSYDHLNQTNTVTEWDGGVWIYKYDDYLNVQTVITDPSGAEVQKTYDNSKNLLSVIDELGNITKYTYDEYGNMTSVTDPDGNITTYTYNGSGQVTSIKDAVGDVTAYIYDEKGNLISLTDPSGATTQYRYDSKGNITELTNPAGQTTTFTYDEYNNRLTITDPTGAITIFTYDIMGNMTSETDPEGNITRFEYNSLYQLVKLTDPMGNDTTYTYDANGNRSSVTDANGNTTYYEYNFKSQLLKVTDALGNITAYTYGGTGCSSCGGGGGNNLTSITDAKGNITTYQYDTLGRLIKETDSPGNAISYTYDKKGNLISKTDANGNTTTYIYDSLGRMIEKSYPDGSGEAYLYNEKGNIIYAGNNDIAYEFTYDANGRVTSVTDSSGLTTGYEYDAPGNRTKMITPEGDTITYTYNASNKLTQLNSPAGIFEFEYDYANMRIILTYPNGVRTTYEYDSGGRLTSLLTQNSALRTLNSHIYTHDKVGNRLTKTETDKKYTYNYDSIYRLLESVPAKLKHGHKEHEKGHGHEYGNSVEHFTYDQVGNRMTGPETKDYYNYNEGNQLTGDRKHRYEYDKNGNLIKKTEIDDDDGEEEQKNWTYFYDYEDRLIKVHKQEQDEIKTVTFKYGPLGRRIEKKIEDIEDGRVEESKTYTYVYDDEDIILEYLTKSKKDDKKEKKRTEVTRYIHGPGIDEPLAVEQKERFYYYHADGLGSITALTDKKGKVVQEYEYDSFGNMKHHGHKVKQPYTFTGREWDKETGLYYYRARYYDAEVGRFIAFDPILRSMTGLSKNVTCGQVPDSSLTIPAFTSLIENPQNLNPFGYVGNQPINYIDPQGLARREDKEKARSVGDLCTSRILQRNHDGSCPNWDDCLVCCGDLLSSIPIMSMTEILLICESVCISGLKLYIKRNKICCPESKYY